MAQIGAQFVNAVQPAPVGTVLYDWPSNNPPTGWVVMDGQAVSRTAYADLYNVIGTTYGVGDGSTTFNLPKQAFASDASGRPRTPYRPVFSGWRDAGNSVNSTWVCNQVSLNVGNHYNPSNGVFTCPVAGVYMMYMQGIGYNNPDYGYIRPRKNGNNMGEFAHYNLSGFSGTQGASWANPNVLVFVSCAANDQLTFYTQNAGSNPGIYGINHNNAVIALMG